MFRSLLIPVCLALLVVDAASQQPAGVADEPTPIAGIPGIVADGARLEVVKAGFTDTEGPLPTSDGGLYFTEQRTNRIYRLDPGGAIRVFRESTMAANGLALDRHGNVLAAEGDGKRITRTNRRGEVTVVADHPAAGQEFLRPNDVIADRRGGIYVTDPGPTTNTGTAFVYYIRPGGHVVLVTDKIARPNGVTLTNDGKVLLVDDTRGNTVFAFDVQRDGSAVNMRPFAQLQGIPAGQPSIADGMTLDRQGRVYVTTVTGIQIFSAAGAYIGTIPPRQAQNVAFGGQDKRTLYITARGVLYKLKMLSQGPDRPGK